MHFVGILKKPTCIDATHGTNMYGHLLVTVMVIDDYGSGVPVAWLITKSENTESLIEFFTGLKRKYYKNQTL